MELSFKGIADHLDQMDKQSVERIKSINEKMESLSKQVESGQTIVNEWGELVAQVKSHAEDMKALNDFADTMQKSLKKKEEEEKSANFNSVIESLIKDNHEKIKSGKNGQLLILNNENYSFQKDMSF